jgi:AraC-like DNA-binding protein
MDKIYAEYQHKSEWQHSMLLSYVSIFLIYCSRLYTQQFKNEQEQPESLLLSDFLGLIDDSYKELHEVSQYASQLNISAGYLGDTIKLQSGKSAIAHIQERIILEAKRLIYFTEESMKEVAFNLGFEDASYFNRFFKRHTDFTTMAYIKTYPENVPVIPESLL